MARRATDRTQSRHATARHQNDHTVAASIDEDSTVDDATIRLWMPRVTIPQTVNAATTPQDEAILADAVGANAPQIASSAANFSAIVLAGKSCPAGRHSQSRHRQATILPCANRCRRHRRVCCQSNDSPPAASNATPLPPHGQDAQARRLRFRHRSITIPCRRPTPSSAETVVTGQRTGK